MPFVDKTLHCLDCGKEFVFSAHEQEFYASKGLTNEPLRCKDCRDARDLPASSDDVV
jgi:DNA-directed RNA polymerase subunit RPC12/RpoP